jgi:hypothetical protein
MRAEDIFVTVGIVLLGYAIFVILLGIHEAGHLLAGIAVGFEVVSCRVGPFEFRRGNGWSMDWRWGRLFTGNIKARASSRSLHRVRLRYLICVLAGPMASLLPILLAIPLASTRGIPAECAGYCIIVSVYLALGTLFPAHTKTASTDGMKILILLFGRAGNREKMLASLTVYQRVKDLQRIFKTGDTNAVRKDLDEVIRICELVPGLENSPYLTVLRGARTELNKALDNAILHFEGLCSS